MGTLICFDNLKDAALLYDRVLPIAFRKSEISTTECIFDFPERLYSRELVDIVFDSPELNQSGHVNIINSAFKVFSSWSCFNYDIRGFNYRTTKSSLDESYEKLQNMYLNNELSENSISIRQHFIKYAQSLGIKKCDVLLPGDNVSVLNPVENLAMTLSHIPLVDTSTSSWEQILEVRRDIKSRKKLQRLRIYLAKNYSGKSASFIEDEISVAIEDYELARKKHGFETIMSSISVLLDSKNIQSAAIAGIGAASIAGLEAGVSGALIVELGKFTIELAKKRHAMRQWESSHDLAYLIELKRKL
ncbi:hypothetical protein RZ186_003784 [Vibrio cholerae]|uniref:hypothetical protein n=1 Tax=Vibrio metoecus TaxID=1481663 RepID=UPI0015954B50|nr:hypothetical protein [Vibrio metoecus]EKG0020488.1 hypothetical protein [Vibrio cholerae]ELA3033199.1 hypothetical protein [Vibrio cholerae]ELN7718519.1 hypothetical protein [Vibrio cholerae]